MVSRYRRDITGLRSLAVGLVLAYHAGVPGFGGGFVGVDVFFVVSGYLITGLLVRELEEHGRINLWRFYARRARRLLPASSAVLLFVALVVFITPRWLPGVVLPQLFGRSISSDIQQSAVYLVNWRFAEQSISYAGSEEFGSPVLHFWSLAVEEQFYAVWPVLVMVVAGISARSTKALGVVIATITALSLFHSWQFSAVLPDQAYFITTTRIWEMALGGLLAIAAPSMLRWLEGQPAAPGICAFTRLVLPLSVAAIFYSATQFSASTAYPGTAALIPTLATAAILFAGSLRQVNGVVPFGTRLLEVSPMQWLGDRSYSVYLWHWPALWLATAMFGPLSWAISVAVVLVSIVPAAASYRFIESPIRHGARWSGRPGFVMVGAGFLTLSGYALGTALFASVATFGEQSVVPEPVQTESSKCPTRGRRNRPGAHSAGSR